VESPVRVSAERNSTGQAFNGARRVNPPEAGEHLGGKELVFRVNSPVCKFKTFYPFKMFHIVCNKH